jgi:hypothetical protein
VIRRLRCISFVCVCLLSSPVLAQEMTDEFPYDHYQSTTLATLEKEADRIKEESGQAANLDAKVVIPAERFRLRLVFAGDVRPLSQENKSFLKFVAGVLRHIPAKQWELYTHEIHIKRGASDLWFPIQGEILKTLVPKLSPGTEFDAYVFWLGESSGQEVCAINAARTFKR